MDSKYLCGTAVSNTMTVWQEKSTLLLLLCTVTLTFRLLFTRCHADAELEELLEEARRVDPTVTDYIATYTKDGKKGKRGKNAKQPDLEAGSAPTTTLA